MRIKSNANKEPAGRTQGVTTLGQLVARLQDQLPDDAAVVAAIDGLVRKGRLRRAPLQTPTA